MKTFKRILKMALLLLALARGRMNFRPRHSARKKQAGTKVPACFLVPLISRTVEGFVGGKGVLFLLCSTKAASSRGVE